MPMLVTSVFLMTCMLVVPVFRKTQMTANLPEDIIPYDAPSSFGSQAQIFTSGHYDKFSKIRRAIWRKNYWTLLGEK